MHYLFHAVLVAFAFVEDDGGGIGDFSMSTSHSPGFCRNLVYICSCSRPFVATAICFASFSGLVSSRFLRNSEGDCT